MFDTPILQRCKHPVRIPDTLHGGYMYVPCGHCVACRANYRNKWMQRISLECQSSISVLFFTLTYDNNHVPLMTFGDDGFLHSNRTPDDDVDLSLMSTSDYLTLYKSAPRLQLSRYSYDELQFSYVCKSDVQKFFKRLRRRLDYDTRSLLSSVSVENRSFRYFVCSEYGPQTFRAHYHGLLFFKDERVSHAVEKFYFRDSWKLCDVSNMPISKVVSSAPSYVAKYVSCDSKLPDILKLPQFSTFHLASKSPAIGCTSVDYSSMSDKVHDSCLTYDSVNVIPDFGVDHVELPYPAAVLSRFFPKPLAFASMDYNTLISFYSHALSELPNCIKLVASKYHIRDYITVYGVSSKSTYSSHLNDFTDYEFCYGVPQNLHCLRVARSIMLRNHISVHDYVSTLLHCFTLRFSSTLKFYYDVQNFLVSQNVSWLQIAYFCNPDLFIDFKSTWRKMHNCSDMVTYYDILLSSYNVSVSDYYGVDGRLIDGVALKLFDYTLTSYYKSFLDFLHDENIKFDKTRYVNHVINQNSNSYESF